MASTVTDVENSNTQLGAMMKPNQDINAPRTSQTKIGLSEVGHTSQRSFGDISNKVRSSVKKIKDQNTSAEKLHKTFSLAKEESIPSPEFFPEIVETEDYYDIIPPAHRLTDQELSNFVQFWKVSHEPKISELDFMDSPVKSKEDLALMSPIKEKMTPVCLSPLFDHVLDLPPPPWE
ncbi:uncharacterized protein LOC121877938 [Homarus americanus]|nr:uncharacterized protein LOC121877938 [Homarus americanus]XP_042239843.1 uncharacterized protein LOC121877938 [Homarus americanus]XP_042239844.1 uncharacterized protein LOC121877938 [Homarus americanus]XP_042239845.1 uncharacterized protein LOC121877938 [Homarus americanus]XP_042239846.1 uncharacterized protein LOC121877938 [Homarus americanus]